MKAYRPTRCAQILPERIEFMLKLLFRSLPVAACLLFLLCSPIAFSAESVPITAPERTVRIGSEFVSETIVRQVDYLEDRAGLLTIRDVSTKPTASRFAAIDEPTIDFGITRSVYWLRFSTNNTTPNPIRWLLEIAYPMIGSIEFYMPGENGFIVKKAGALLPFELREANHPNIVFSLTQKSGLSTYYMRVASHTSSLHIPITICTPNCFFEKNSNATLLSGIFYGIFIVTLAYNLFLLISIRERAYFYYACYVAAFMGMHLAFDGIGYQLLWTKISCLNIPSFHIFIVNITIFLFTIHFLEIKTYLPSLQKYFYLYIAILFLSFCLNLLYPYSLTKASILLTFLSCIILISTGFAAWKRKNRAAFFYLISWLFLLSGAVVRGMMALNLLPFTKVLDYLFQFSASAQVVIFSLALGDRVNSMRKALAYEVIKQKRAKEEIHKSERHYRSIIENMQDLVSQVDEKGVVHYASPSHESILGYDNREIVGKPIFELLHPDDSKNVVQVFRNSRNYKEPVHIEFRIRSSAGEYIWLESVASVILDSDGKFTHFLIGSRNITARKEMELALTYSQEKFSKAFHASPNIVAISSVAEGRYLEVNDTFVEILGYNREEAVGRTSKELQIMKDPAVRERIVNELKMHGRIRSQEAVIMTKSGEERIGSFSAEIINVKGERCLFTVVQDITEKKRNEEEKRQLQNLLSDIIDSMPSAIIGVDRDLWVTNWNKKAEKWLGITEKEALGHALEKMIPKLIEDFSLIEKTIKGSHIRTFDNIGLQKGESHRFIDLTIYPLSREENGGAVIRMDDVTDKLLMEEERRRLAEGLSHAQKMESLGTLAGGIAHDFNNILSAILGFAQLARLDGPDPAKIGNYIQKIEEAGIRAKKLVEQILSFSRQQKGEKQSIDMGIITKEALELLRASLPSTIEIKQDIKSGLGVILADPTQIHQIIMNICTNAFHAMQDEGGILEVNLEAVEDPFTKPEISNPGSKNKRYMKLTVSDNGCGINERTSERIFEPYFTTKEIGVGTGLGLSVVKGIVENHNGLILFDSKIGRGTVFTIYIPCYEKKADTPEKKTDEIPKGEGMILLVDDEKFVAEMGKEMLLRLGYHVDIEIDPVKALETFQKNAQGYDLVITDMTMPRMTGDIFTQKIHDIRPEIPVVICTGYNVLLSPEKKETIGSKEFLLKPYTIVDLAQTIQRAMG